MAPAPGQLWCARDEGGQEEENGKEGDCGLTEADVVIMIRDLISIVSMDVGMRWRNRSIWNEQSGSYTLQLRYLCVLAVKRVHALLRDIVLCVAYLCIQSLDRLSMTPQCISFVIYST